MDSAASSQSNADSGGANASTPRRKRSRRLYYCGHCKEEVSKTLYYQHRKLFYDSELNIWADCTSEDPRTVDSETDFSFNSESDTGVDYNMESAVCSSIPSEDDIDFLEDENGKLEIWSDSEFDISESVQLQSSDNFSHTRIIRLYLMFMFTWQTLFRLSDVGLNVLLAFISMFIGLLANVFKVNSIQTLSEHLPNSVRKAKIFLGCYTDAFKKYVSCRTCHSIYNIEDCKVVLPNKSVTSAECSHIAFPNHPHSSRRLPCKTLLMKSIRTSSGSHSLYPQQMYCYKSVIRSMQELLMRPGFVESCERWRICEPSLGIMNDIYDGKIWKESETISNKPFLSLPYNYAFSLNIDWFQPFKHTQHSIGAIYLSIQNLPRRERFKRENVLLVGVIPGPHEPSKSVNTYLSPLVEELKKLWDGVVLATPNGSLIVRGALICVACDIPAARKVCGYVAHNALHACSRCLKTFPTEAFGEKADYSGYDRENWVKRTNETHRQKAEEYRKCNTLSSQKAIERSFGCRYSVLLELPYFDVVRMCVIDPMHNLLLGTAKHMLTVWKSCGYLNDTNLANIQRKVDSFIVPDDVGRIPAKISSGFSGFTADQWKNWTLLYSLSSVKEILPPREYHCWLLFVKACSLLCRRQISEEQLERADTSLLSFCTEFEKLYDHVYCTINMHLHCHLKECIEDYGPVYTFWLFSFERLNGILGSYHTNNHDISLQLMRHFMSSNEFCVQNWPSEYRDNFSTLLHGHDYAKGSLIVDTLEAALQESVNSIKSLPPVCEVALLYYQKESLINLIAQIVGHNQFDLRTLYQKCSALMINSFIVGSKSSRYSTSSHVMAVQPDDLSQKPKLALIDHYLEVDVLDHQSKEQSLQKSMWFAAVNFYHEHHCRVWFGSPIEVWSTVTCSDLSYIPIQHIKSRVAYSKQEVNFGRIIGTEVVLVVSPLLENLF